MCSEIAQLLRQRQAVQQFNALQQRVSDLVSEHPDSLADIETVTGIKAQETDLFSRETIPTALDFMPIVNALFDNERLHNGLNSEIINVGGEQAFVVRVEQHKAAAHQPFDQVAPQIITLVKREIRLGAIIFYRW